MDLTFLAATEAQVAPLSLCPCVYVCVLGRVENRKSWKITKLQVDPIDAQKNRGAFKYYISTFGGRGVEDMTRNAYIVYAI